MSHDKQLSGISVRALHKKQQLDQALNAKEFAILAGVSYSTAREWLHLPGFPALGGLVFWQDFVVATLARPPGDHFRDPPDLLHRSSSTAAQRRSRPEQRPSAGTSSAHPTQWPLSSGRCRSATRVFTFSGTGIVYGFVRKD